MGRVLLILWYTSYFDMLRTLDILYFSYFDGSRPVDTLVYLVFQWIAYYRYLGILRISMCRVLLILWYTSYFDGSRTVDALVY